MSRYPFIARGLLLLCSIMYGTSAYAQAFDESEPNDPCLAAQDVGAFDRPSTIVGSLDTTPDFLDVDFFAFEAAADEFIQVDLEGEYTNAGTLSNPLLGVFNADCALLAVNDDSGGGPNSRLTVTVPSDGKFVLGVTQCCDYSFTGGGVGSYLLTLDRFRGIDSIVGRLVDASSGDPLSGAFPTYASAYLLRCTAGNCFEYVAYVQAGDDGSFSFYNDFYGNPLATGTYQVQASANGFESFTSEPFDVFEAEMRNLGDLRLAPLQLIGSVSGRLVDAISGNALPGSSPPYAYLYMQRCEDWGCYFTAYTTPDDSGRFRFNGLDWNLSPGTYQLVAFAQDYQVSTSDPFIIAAFEDLEFGDFALTPLPIQFGTTQACEIPFGGETCNYSIQITYRGADRRYRGKAWSTVEYYGPTSNYAITRFQVGRNGTRNPQPESVNLRRGQSETHTFQLDVPSSVPVGATICASITIGQMPNAQFNSQGDRFIFCSYKQSQGLVAMPEKEARTWLEGVKSRDRESAVLRDRPSRERFDRGIEMRRPR